MNYTAADVKKLRDETGATFADCKKALDESKDWASAIKWLNERSDKKAEKMITAGRETKEGGVFSYVHHNHRVGVLLELNCTTDFVGKSESFRKLASDLTTQIVGTAPEYISLEEIPAAELEAARQEIIDTDASLARVPAERREAVIQAKLEKALSSKVLTLQAFLKDETVTIGEMLRKAIAETGENIVVRRFARFALGE